MNSNDAKSQDPNKSPFQDPIPSSHEPSHSTEPAKTYSTDPSNYNIPPKSNSAEPSKVYVSTQQENSRIYSGDFKSSSDYTKKDKNYQNKESIEDKVRDSFKNPRDYRKVDEIYDYARNNKEQTITYALLILGLILLFFDILLGGLLIGMVAGYHFSYEIIYYFRHLGQVLTGQDKLRYVVFTGLIFGLFMAAPSFFIGAVVVASFKQVLFSNKGDHSSNER